MRPTLWTTRTATGDAASIIAHPRPGNWLANEMHALRAADVDTVISALTESEARELDLVEEPAAAHAAGLYLAPLPIPDLGVPADTAAFPADLDPLADRVKSGGRVAVHCGAGIGRSGIIATLLLTRTGWQPEAAISRLSTL